MSPVIKNLFFFVTFLGIVYFGYNIFFTDDGEMLVNNSESEAIVAQNNFLAQLKQLGNLELDADIFSSSEFISLTDRRVDVVDEEVGRANPFAPVPGLLIEKVGEAKK